MRHLVADGEWEDVDRLLNEARARFGDNPWLGDVMRSMTELANERDEARLMKESVFFESSACSRLVERNEAMDPAMERVDIPSYLRRKVRQGKAGRV